MSVTTNATHRQAFTLTEILVAMGVFTMLMAIGTASFSGFSRASEGALEAYQLQVRAALIQRRLHHIFQNQLPTAVLWHSENIPADSQDDLVEGITFMTCSDPQQLSDNFRERLETLRQYELPEEFLYEHETENSAPVHCRWMQFMWKNGQVWTRQSRPAILENDFFYDTNADANDRWDDKSHRFRYHAAAYAIPTVQARAVFLADALTDTHAHNIYPVGLARNFDDPKYFEDWPQSAYRDVLFGDKETWDNWTSDGSVSIGGLERPRAVRNPDGRGYNRDWLNLVGSSALYEVEDEDFLQPFPDSRRLLANGLHFLEVEIIDDSTNAPNGDSMTGDEWYGVAPTAFPFQKDMPLVWAGEASSYPKRIHFQFVLHNIPIGLPDDGDIDNDSNYDEGLADALHNLSTNANLDTARADFIDRIEAQGYDAMLVETEVLLPVGN